MTVNVSSMAPGKNYVYLDGAVADKIWVPDVVIDKVRPRDFKSIIISSTTMQTIAIRSPSMVKSGASSIRLYADSTIVYSSRKNYDLACGMVSVLYIISGLFTKSLFVQDFRKFPFDNQTCNLIIHSFGSSTKDYTLKWGLVSCTGWPCPPPYCSLSSPRWMLSTGSSTLTSRKPCRSSRWACSS